MRPHRRPARTRSRATTVGPPLAWAAVVAIALAASAGDDRAGAQERAVSKVKTEPSHVAAADDLAPLANRIAELEQRLRRMELARAREADSLKRLPRPPALGAGAQGFGIRSADGQFQLRFRGYIQSDGRFFVHDVERPAVGTFLMRRVRPIFEATVYRYLDFRIMPDFGGASPTLYDAHVDVRIAPALAVRSGKFKPPVGLERLQSAADLAFVERAHPTNLVPNRDIGVQLYGDLLEGALSYAAGAFNGVPDLGFGDGDNGNDKDLVGRIFVQPFRGSRIVALRELGLGIAGSRGSQHGTVAAPFLQTYRSEGQQPIFAFRADGTVGGTTIADGRHTRVAPQGYYYGGPVGLLWEYVKSTQVVRRGAALGTLSHRAWQATGAVTLTGERQSFRGLVPDHAFDPTHGQWGAVELVARWTRLLVDPGAFPVFANPATQIRDADTWGVGVNWHLSRGVRLLADYNDTRYTGGATAGDRERERSVLTRLQHSF